ncbi:hypothetical protein FLJC2902T_07690 [Flavobacterium limnosediminis JC2902]|uniref:TonB-dependent receptor plug domain-containing protein n=1 Tax=Flavobacterium limnosediminis JC2902 TaxID=1341181 RepID=V6ST70_9FLAO|nr:hypothetical protein [Flavobacterium limnosediminis]ESU29372.1 hypothetical protein FLJC2902T_07690 [Flavobacterium limnosediminis JC2902]
MKLKEILPLFLTLLLQNLSFSQAETGQSSEKTGNALTEYFKLDRENIHLHLNKNVFLTNDEIWFKGYIIEKKSKKPYLPTTNVLIALHDEKGTKIKTCLFYADNGIFEGNIKPDENLSTGTYYLQAYTNYMNNFAEDESSVFELKIINPNDGKTIPNTNTINYNTVTTEFFPESSVFLEGTSNTIAIKITDCSGNGISVKDGEIIDPKGVIITNFSTNELGYGKFEIVQTKNLLYKAVFKINDTKTEKFLPMPSAAGITFSANNYTFEDKTTLKIKTNTNSLAQYTNEPITLVIQQNNYSSFFPFSLTKNSTEQLFTLPNENFKPGINALYLVDKNHKKIAERILFKPLNFDRNIDLKVIRKQNDSILIGGTGAIRSGTLSISVLPNDTKSITDKKTIYSSLLLDNQLNEKTTNENYYLSDFSKKKHYELDTYLICQKSKYNWQNILNTPPKENFDFDSGLTIKGTINIPVKDKASKVQMSSLTSGLEEVSLINDKNEFYFKNILVSDSTLVHFSLLDKKGQISETKLVTQVLNNNRPFIKPFKSEQKKCLLTFSNDAKTSDYSFPKINPAIQLDSMSIVVKKKGPKLTHAKRFNNDMAKGFKILEAESDRDILQFIAANGYIVSIEYDTVRILGIKPTSWKGSKMPKIYWDDVPVLDFNILRNYSLRYVDEIYVNKDGYGGGMDDCNGIIRIYTKKTMFKSSKLKIHSQSFLVKNGFHKINRYINPKYTNYTDDGFINFGTIHWDPDVGTDEKGSFRFTIPNCSLKTVKVVIEGISSDGHLISETKNIEIP